MSPYSLSKSIHLLVKGGILVRFRSNSKIHNENNQKSDGNHEANIHYRFFFSSAGNLVHLHLDLFQNSVLVKVHWSLHTLLDWVWSAKIYTKFSCCFFDEMNICPSANCYVSFVIFLYWFLINRIVEVLLLNLTVTLRWTGWTVCVFVLSQRWYESEITASRHTRCRACMYVWGLIINSVATQMQPWENLCSDCYTSI